MPRPNGDGGFAVKRIGMFVAIVLMVGLTVVAQAPAGRRFGYLLFNGTDLNGWKKNGDEKWIVEQGTILSESAANKYGLSLESCVARGKRPREKCKIDMSQPEEESDRGAGGYEAVSYTAEHDWPLFLPSGLRGLPSTKLFLSPGLDFCCSQVLQMRRDCPDEAKRVLSDRTLHPASRAL